VAIKKSTVKRVAKATKAVTPQVTNEPKAASSMLKELGSAIKTASDRRTDKRTTVIPAAGNKQPAAIPQSARLTYGANITLKVTDPLKWPKVPFQVQGMLRCLYDNKNKLTEQKLIDLIGVKDKQGDINNQYLRTRQSAERIYSFYRKKMLLDWKVIEITD